MHDDKIVLYHRIILSSFPSQEQTRRGEQLPGMSTTKVAIQDPSAPPNDEVAPLDERYSWYRGVFLNASVVGIAAFAAPGLWNAMNSVGAGGQQTPYLVMYLSIECLGPVAAFFLSLPEKVRRRNGTRVQVAE